MEFSAEAGGAREAEMDSERQIQSPLLSSSRTMWVSAESNPQKDSTFLLRLGHVTAV